MKSSFEWVHAELWHNPIWKCQISFLQQLNTARICIGSQVCVTLKSHLQAFLELLNCLDISFADSAQTEYYTTFHCSSVRPSVTGVTSHISHIYKGINAMFIIRGPIKPYIFWIKIILAIFLAKTTPDKTIFSALTNLTIDFDFELSKI